MLLSPCLPMKKDLLKLSFSWWGKQYTPEERRNSLVWPHSFDCRIFDDLLFLWAFTLIHSIDNHVLIGAAQHKRSLNLWGWQWDGEKKKSNGKSEPYIVVKFLGSQWNGTGRAQITVGSLVSREEGATRTFCSSFTQRNISQLTAIGNSARGCPVHLGQEDNLPAQWLG